MPKPAQDKTGDRFQRLTVLSQAESKRQPNGRLRIYWNCACDCGSKSVVRDDSLGKVVSCGCYVKESRHTVHAATGSPEYVAWTSMKRRCMDPNATGFKNYGGRGIKVCDEWLNDFTAFYDHVGPRPTSKHSLDRIDNDGDYEPGNVRWATSQAQAKNRRNARPVPEALYRLLTEPMVFTYEAGCSR